MGDTRIAPRRLPFPIGTKMFFFQAVAPADWVIDNTKDDRYLRVVSGVGGAVGGPDNAVTVSNPNLQHRHDLNNHTHSVQSHTHPLHTPSSTYHAHSFGSYGTTTGSTLFAYESYNVNYRIRDDNVPYWQSQSTAYLDIDGGGGGEGHHNHWIDNTGGPRNSLGNVSNTGTTAGSFNTGGNSSNMGYSMGTHSHSVDSTFRPAYADVIIAELTG